MMKLFSFKICPCYQSIAAILEYLGEDYESSFLDLTDVPEWFFDISPGLEPVLEVGENKFIAGFGEIIRFLRESRDAKFDRLFYNGSERFVQLAISSYINQCKTQRAENEKEFLNVGKDFFNALDQMNESYVGPYFLGDEFTITDLLWSPILYRARMVEDKTSLDYFAEFNSVKLWQNKLLAMSFLASSVSHDFDKVFDDFYLNDQTFIGKLKKLHLG